jgi:hypothetical protein
MSDDGFGYSLPSTDPTLQLPENLPGCRGDYHQPGDAGHSVWYPKAGDFRGDSTVENGGLFDHPLDTIEQAASRFVSYGNWAGPGNNFENQIKAKMACDPSYDPSTDPALGKQTSIDGLDDAARQHDLAYYKAIGLPGKETADMFSLDGILATADADRKLQQAAEREMASPSVGKDGKPTSYSDDTRAYAAGMQGFFGGRADGVDIRNDYMDGKIDAVGMLEAAGNDISTAYDKNGITGAAGEGLGLLNVAGAQALHSAAELGKSAMNSLFGMFSD